MFATYDFKEWRQSHSIMCTEMIRAFTEFVSDVDEDYQERRWALAMFLTDIKDIDLVREILELIDEAAKMEMADLILEWNLTNSDKLTIEILSKRFKKTKAIKRSFVQPDVKDIFKRKQYKWMRPSDKAIREHFQE